MHEYIKILAIVCPLVFAAGFVDAMAGGGGVISLPAYLFAGLPPHMALGTNKFAMCLGTSVSSFNFIRAKKVNFSAAVFSILGALIGSAVGSKFALFISEDSLKLLLLVILPVVAVVLATQKNFKTSPVPKNIPLFKFRAISFVIGLVIGMYDGLAGPGTGTFMILAFTGILSLDLVTASGCAKVSNLASNIAALTVYLLNGKVIFWIGIPAAACAVLGNFIGSKLAIKGGEKYIRSIMFFVIILLFVKSAYDFFM